MNNMMGFKSLTLFLRSFLMFLGLGQANSKYACIWCLVPASDRYDYAECILLTWKR